MSVLILQHGDYDVPGVLGESLRDTGHRLRVIRLDLGQPLPPDLDDVDGVVSLGGAMNVDQADEHPWIKHEMDVLRAAHERELPIVGVCLGAQLIAAALGGEVAPMQAIEAGFAPVTLGFHGTVDPIYAGIGWRTIQFHAHGQEVTQPPDGATILAQSKQCKVQAYRVGLTTYGFQYHFEWDRAQLLVAAKDPMFAQAGLNGQIEAQCATHYADYRRLGTRLAQRIAMLLFPVDKR